MSGERSRNGHYPERSMYLGIAIAMVVLIVCSVMGLYPLRCRRGPRRQIRYCYNPSYPVPFITEPTSSQIGGPDDYSPIHRRDDVLVYTSDQLDEPMEVTGPVKVQLFASSSAPDTDFMAQLHDVWPNGYAQRLCDGMVRVRFRNGMDKPEFLKPGTITVMKLTVGIRRMFFFLVIAFAFHITSSAFPKI